MVIEKNQNRVLLWNRIFTKRGRRDKVLDRKDLVVLYWYLLHKPDYAYNIAENIKKFKLKKNDKRGNIPETLRHDSNVRTALKEMCEKGLIEQYKEKDGAKYYKVNPAFLCLPYYDERVIRDPRFKKDTIDRYSVMPEGQKDPVGWEFRSAARRAVISKHEDRAYLITSYGKDLLSPSIDNKEWLSVNSINEILEFVQKISRDPEKFLTHFTKLKKLNYISLWMLIQDMFHDLHLYVKPHNAEFLYSPDPFNRVVILTPDHTAEKAKKELERYYKEFHEFYSPQRLIDGPLEDFGQIADTTDLEMAEKSFKERIEEKSILDLKKIHNIPEKEIPKNLEMRLLGLYHYLDFLINTYSRLKFGSVTNFPYDPLELMMKKP